ncbi:MAG: hypothetical protein A3K57_09710, partial [Caulobacterales bacterium RIFOXYA1_FULL_67_7]
VKMQIYTADEMCLPGVKCPAGPWKGQDLYKLYERTWTPWEWWPVLRDYTTARGVTLFSSAFSPEAARYLYDEGCPALKIASHEAGWTALTNCHHRSMPLIVSACTRGAARRAVDHADVVLWCPTGYPAADLDPLDMGWLMAVVLERVMRRRFVAEYPAVVDETTVLEEKGVLIGLSDNGIADSPPAWATAIRAGAVMIEAHIMLPGTPSPDEAFSLVPREFAYLVQGARTCPGPPAPQPSPYRRSWWAVRDIRAGATITAESARVLRPAGGLEPSAHVIGRRAARDLEVGPLREEDIE